MDDTTQYVHYLTDGRIASVWGEVVDGAESQGLFAIGSECAKRLPARFHRTMAQWGGDR